MHIEQKFGFTCYSIGNILIYCRHMARHVFCLVYREKKRLMVPGTAMQKKKTALLGRKKRKEKDAFQVASRSEF